MCDSKHCDRFCLLQSFVGRALPSLMPMRCLISEIQQTSDLMNRIDPWYDLLAGCNSEQAAAGALGFTQGSWDNLSGQEKQPTSSDKYWTALTQHEQAAAIALGYTKTTWDNMSGSEPRPASASKGWSELTSCGEILSVSIWRQSRAGTSVHEVSVTLLFFA